MFIEFPYGFIFKANVQHMVWLFNQNYIRPATIGYPLVETEGAERFQNKKMLQRLQEIMKLPEQERSSILLTPDHFIKASMVKLI